MKLNYRVGASLIILIIAAGGAAGRPASAQAPAKINQAPSGITVSPAFQQVSVRESEAEHPLEFKITNNRADSQTISISTADFNALSESGGLFFVGTNPTQLQKKYGLAAWLSLPQSTITIPPRQTATLKAVVLNQPSLAPGGHYGALMLAINSPAGGLAENKIALQPIASSLLFVTKLGGDTHKLELSNVNFKRAIFNLPNEVSLRFRNKGNTHVTPRGTVTVTDRSGKLISKGIINNDSALILPETFRSYQVPLQKVSSAKLPGRYILKVNYRFDGFDGLRTYQKSFLLFSWPWLIILAGLGGVIFAGTWVVLKRPAYVKKLLPKLNKK